MRTVRVVAVAVLLAGCPEAPAPPPPAALEAPVVRPLEQVPAAQVAQLVEVEGQVNLERKGKVAPATPGPLLEDDTVATGPASRAVLKDPMGRAIELDEDTRFKLGARLASLELETGAVSFGSDDGGAGWRGVTLKTSAGTAKLDDTVGRLQVVDGGVLGQLTFGEIEFELPDAGTTTVKKGDFSVGLGAVELELPPEAPRSEGLKVVVDIGRPTVRRPGEKGFKPMTSGDELPAGSAFLLPVGASARLLGGRAEVTLAPGSSGVAEGLRDESGVPLLALSKFIGSFSLQLKGAGTGGVQLGETSVTGSTESTVVISQVGKKRRVEVRAGEVVTTVAGKSSTLTAGDVFAVEGTKGGASELRPALVVGSSSRVRVHAAGAQNVAILLRDDTNRVQVARDESFAAPLISGTVGKQVVVPALTRGTLFYRTTDASGQVLSQGRVDFADDVASARDTATRSDHIAETGQKASVYYQSRVPALTFNFAATEGARSWRFRLYRDNQFDKVLIDRETTEPRLVLESGALGEGQFQWSATPLDVNGREKAGSRYNKLEVLYDNARTTLLIDRPLAGERATNDTTAVGVAPARSQLFINGKLVKPDERGRFSVKVGAVEAVLFRVVSGDTESHWLRRLTK